MHQQPREEADGITEHAVDGGLPPGAQQGVVAQRLDENHAEFSYYYIYNRCRMRQMEHDEVQGYIGKHVDDYRCPQQLCPPFAQEPEHAQLNDDGGEEGKEERGEWRAQCHQIAGHEGGSQESERQSFAPGQQAVGQVKRDRHGAVDEEEASLSPNPSPKERGECDSCQHDGEAPPQSCPATEETTEGLTQHGNEASQQDKRLACA